MPGGDGRLNPALRARVEAYGGLVVLGAIWSYTWILIKVASFDAGPFLVAAIRPGLGALVLFAVLAAMRRPLRPTPLRDTIVFGLLQTTGWTLFQTFGVMLGGAGKTALLAYTMPFWIVLIAWPALGERITAVRWLALVLAAAGLALIVSPLAPRTYLADLCAIAAGLCWGAATVWTKRMQRDASGGFDILALTAWQMVWGSIPLAILVALFPEPLRLTPAFVGSMAFMITLSQAFGWVLWLFIVARLPAGVAGIASLFTPVLVVGLAALQLHEIPTPHELLGMALLLVALVVTATKG